MQTDLDECRRRLPLPLLMQQLGFAVQTGQNSYCPFHPDQKSKHKSFSMSQRSERYFWRCWGQCAEGGDEVRFLEKLRGISNREAIRLYKELAGVTPRPKSEPDAPLNWGVCVKSFTEKHLEQFADWRGYTGELCSWLKDKDLIGLFRDCLAFPVDDGTSGVKSVHYRLKDGSWRYYPPGIKIRPFVIGGLLPGGNIHAFESQFDAFSFMSLTSERIGIIITRGAANGALVADFLPEEATLYLWPQNDAAGKKWERDIIRATKRKRRVMLVKICAVPLPYKDLNDWSAAGAASDDLFNAMRSAETIATAQGSNHAEEIESSNGALVVDPQEDAELEPEPEEPEEEIEDFPVDCLPDTLRDEAKSITDTIGVNLSMSSPEVLGFASASIGKRLCVKTSRGETRGNLFILLCKTSGSGGSKTYDKASAPFRGFQSTLRREFKRDQKPHIDAALKDVEGQIHKLEQELRSRNKEQRDRGEIRKELEGLNREYEKLKQRRSKILYVTNVTPASLTKLLAEGDGTILHVEPDAGTALALIKGEGTDKKEGVICPFDVWLKGYSGDEISNHRISSGEQYVEDPCISMLFIVTPDKVRPLFEDSRMTTGGLLPRFLICDPRSHPVEDKPGASGELPTEISEAYESSIFAVLNKFRLLKEKREEVLREVQETARREGKKMPSDDDLDEIEVEPYEIEVTTAAQKIITADYNRFAAMCSDGEDHPFESRWTEQMIRIAVVLHVFRCIRRVKGSDGRFHSEAYAEKHLIDEATMEDARRIRDWFNKHQERMRRPETEKAREDFADWLKRKFRDVSTKVGITAREIYRNGKFSEVQTKQFLEEFRIQGKVDRFNAQIGPTGGKPRTPRIAYRPGPLWKSLN